MKTISEVRKMKKSELKSELNQLGQNTAGLDRKGLIDLYINTVNTSSIDTATVDEVSGISILPEPSDKTLAEPTQSSKQISKNDIEWSAKVLQQFHESELVEGFPTADGLRRVFQLMVGPILNTYVTVIQPPVSSNFNRATVKVAIEYMNNDFGRTCIVEDVADCDKANTKYPYHIYPSATAATMAESRAMRKKLGLKVVSAEEKQLPANAVEEFDAADTTKASDVQVAAITKLSQKFGINITKLITKVIKNGPSQTNELSHEQAQKVLKQLNNFDRTEKNGGESIPEELFDK